MEHITILAFENALGTSVILPMELWYIADLVWRKYQNNVVNAELRFDIVTQDGNDVTSFSGVPIIATAAIDDVKTTDLIIISGVWKEIDTMLNDNTRTVPWLIEHHQKGAAISSVSTGTFLLAETGLLDEKEATTYWRYVNLFKQKYPKVKLHPEKMITSVDNLSCYSGMNSGCDLAIYVIEKTYGVQVAQQVEKYYLFDSARVYKSSNITFMGQKFHKDQSILSVQQWVENNYAKNFLIEEVALRFGMSLRNLTRRFKMATGESLLTYLHRYRIEIAKELLKTSDFTIQEIAYQVGYEDISFFYRLFKKHTALTPKAYRKNS